jgi:hypothetical protein
MLHHRSLNWRAIPPVIYFDRYQPAVLDQATSQMRVNDRERRYV